MFAFIHQLLRNKKAFSQHFSMEHQFHGVKNHLISESYFVIPKSKVAIQLFHEGIQFPSIELHLQCKIDKTLDHIQVQFHVHDPAISKNIMKQIEQDMTEQLLKFQQMITNDPRLNYVKEYCSKCHYKDHKPFTVCIKTCDYKEKE